MPGYYRAPCFPSSALHLWLDSTRQFHSHYESFLFNHLAHNFVAIAASSSGLQRSPEQLQDKLKWWSDLYIKENDLRNAPARIVTADMPVISMDNWRTHVDRTIVNYPAYLEFFDKQLLQSDSASVSEVLQTFVPQLGKGLAGSALHGIIHLGFAVEANHRGMISEGLANLCTVFLPLGSIKPESKPLWVAQSTAPSHSRGLIDTAKVFLQEAVEMNGFESLRDLCREPQYMSQDIGAFQRKVFAFNDPTVSHLDNALNKYFPLALPDLVSRSDDTETMSLLPAVQEAQALISAAYLASDCEFFVIHGVTSLHAVLVIMQHLSPIDQRELLVHWLRTILVVYVAVNTPGLGTLVELLETWQEKQASYHPDVENSLAHQNSLHARREKDLWATRLSLSQLSNDEHVPKAVYVLWRWTNWSYHTVSGDGDDINHEKLSPPPHLNDLFVAAVDNQLRPLRDTGEVLSPQSHVWFSR